ncbi:MAG: 2Fe-2S iron-sulfur cluster-binding protein, partial [Alphaproteobacteria bacterium]|nr:2Fe-2S iron-sulfur cluster-binding protein [Alphaproteobacteria bacterium]
MTQLNRLDQGGRIDRSRPLSFHFDGKPLMGFHGDTLASALLANDVRLIGRSFKYHRPRGLLSAGAEEPNGLVQLGTGARTTPNARATQISLINGLEASSQNAWPSVAFDFSAINNLFSPLLPAGFYYKTFMWPAGFWERYEYFIRRAAGLGRAPSEPDPDRYEHRFAHCDVLVVGAGPAGLSAATAAARAGARVILADEQQEHGGWLLGECSDAGWAPLISGAAGSDWISKAMDELRSLDNVRLLSKTTVFGYYDHNFITAVEELDQSDADPTRIGKPSQRVWKIRAQRVVLATGAIERPLVFHNNDRPGIMLAGAARTYLNRYGVRAGKSAILFTNNDNAYTTALDLARAGTSVEAIVDVRDRVDGPLCAEARAQGIEVLEGYAVIDTAGWKRLRSVTVAKMREDRQRVESTSRTIACDLLAMSGGWNPAVHLFSQARGRLQFDPERGIFIPGEAPQPLHTCGACAGEFTLLESIKSGAKAGLAAAREAGFSGRAARAPAVREPVERPWENLWVVPSDRHSDRTKAFVDFQNDVKVSDLRLAVREGYRSVEHVKRYTTQGMATDQGKTGNVAALAVVADAVGEPIHQIGTTTFRPPYTPVTFGAIAGRHTGEFLDIVRTTPMHRWHAQAGAIFEPVGQWRRAMYYPREGENMDAAVSREVRAVREAVGMLDASTLGKIDIQGRDACELLNRVYTNAWSKLQVGRARY